MDFGASFSQTVKVNGRTVYKSSFSPCCGRGYYPPIMGSCFGWGYPSLGCCCFPGSLESGLGFAVGMAAVPLLPALFKGIGQGLCWVGKNVIAPAAKGIWKGTCWVGNQIGKGAKWVAKKTGLTKLWNKIFHKKSKEV